MKLASIFLSLLFLGFLSETGSRFFYESVTPESGRRAVHYLISPPDNPRQLGKITMHPYMLYVHTPNFSGSGFQQINSLGYRGKEFDIRPKTETVRILTLGGSTTYGDKVRNPLHTWSAELENLLRLQSELPVEVINGGLGAALSADLLAQYSFRHRYLKSDIVILHVGWNDTTPLVLANYDPEYARYRGWKRLPLAGRAGERTILQSYAIRVAYAWWLRIIEFPRGMNLNTFFFAPTDYFNLKPDHALANAMANEPLGFRRNLDLLIRNIINDGALPVLFPVPIAPVAIFDRVDYPMHKEAWDAFELARSKNVRVMREIAAAYQLPFLELDAGALSVDHFADHAHLTHEGHVIKARFLADKLPELISHRMK